MIRRLVRVAPTVLVATLMVAVVAQAAEIQVPAYVTIHYDLFPGETSKEINIPWNTPVLLMGVCMTEKAFGVAYVTIMTRPDVGNNFLVWVGHEAPSQFGSAVTQGFSNVAGKHIAYLDYTHYVDIEVASAADGTVRIHNSHPTSRRKGYITLIW
jgi:hypothetical protein